MGSDKVDVESLRILVVDDHMIMRNLVTQQLKILGVKSYDTATNGQEALDLLNGKLEVGMKYDIVLMDWSMPVMDGMEFLKACRSRKEFDDVAFVMLTGECEQKSIVEAIKAGVTSYITKPVSQDDLNKKIQKIVQWLAERRRNKQEKPVYG